MLTARRHCCFRLLNDSSPIAIFVDQGSRGGRVDAYEPGWGWESVDAVAMIEGSEPAPANVIRRLRKHLLRRGFDAAPVTKHIRLHPEIERALGRQVSEIDLMAARAINRGGSPQGATQ